MIDTNSFGNKLKGLGFDFYSGVPCSFLKNLINYAINECDYVMAANEGDAVAISSGAVLGGKKAVVLMQNSGLTNATSPLTSLNAVFRLPVLGFVSHRGEPGLQDEPQHELMGTITAKMLELMNIPWEYLSTNMEEASAQLIRANHYIERNQSFFFIVKKNTFEKVVLKEQKLHTTTNLITEKQRVSSPKPLRYDVLERLNLLKDKETILLATTGMTGRELYEVEDAENNLYMVGSMGCISSLGLGLAKVQSGKDIIVIDGDGSLLMRLGALATNAYYSPKNLLHILIDNNVHDSTGSQATISHNIDFVQVAASVGYIVSISVDGLEAFEKAYSEWKRNRRLTFIRIFIDKGARKEPGRPHIKPYEVKERLMNFIHEKN